MDLARHFGQGTIQSKDIADRQDIPEPYLNQLLTLLRKAGLIISRRGPGGGHVLARPASEITIADLVIALEGTICPIDEETVPEFAGARGSQVLREVWQDLGREAERLLKGYTLADLLERERRRAFTYQI